MLQSSRISRSTGEKKSKGEKRHHILTPTLLLHLVHPRRNPGTVVVIDLEAANDANGNAYEKNCYHIS